MVHSFPTTINPTTVALVLAGGRGSRLAPLTDYRSKPAVPFAGNYRLIDVALSNLSHSRIDDVWVVEQYRPFTLNTHLAAGRPWDLDGTRHGLRIMSPAEGRDEDGFSEGNGHALYQQMDHLEAFGADTVIVMSADHLYQLDLRQVLSQHAELGSDVTVVTTEVEGDVSRYGVVQANKDRLITEYDYKPENPKGNLVATEIFVFKISALRAAVDNLIEDLSHREDDETPEGNSLGDYGETILPYMVKHNAVHEFRHEGYWRDIGTIDAFFRAHMDLIEGAGLELDRRGWEILAHLKPHAPTRISATASVTDSLIAQGAVIYGTVDHSVIGPEVVIEEGAHVSRSVLLGRTVVPSGARLESVVADIGAPVEAKKIGETKPGPGNITVLTAPGGGPDTV